MQELILILWEWLKDNPSAAISVALGFVIIVVCLVDISMHGHDPD